MLPPTFIEALRQQEEVMVSSREGSRVRSVRAWYVVGPDERIYLFTYSFALRAARWRQDPWVRLMVPGGPSVEGTAHFVSADELDDSIAPLIMERWWLWGATTEEGLRRMLRDQSHVLVRVDVP